VLGIPEKHLCLGILFLIIFNMKSISQIKGFPLYYKKQQEKFPITEKQQEKISQISYNTEKVRVGQKRRR
jgi:hypothetical protein